ncbi:MAG: DUF6371 domain-containing protein [Bacteroidota bacterium]|nr:DUF6371 domain-containing protein [Bacteroidota bacterium]
MNKYITYFEPLPKLQFDKNRARVKHCPCGKSNKGKFAPYIGYNDKGKCFGCGETFLPEIKSNNESWKFSNKAIKYKNSIAQLHTIKKASFIPVKIFKESLKHHLENNFIKYLITLFGSEITNQLISKYFIGTSKHWNGATVFWQIDITSIIRTGKIMLYNAITGKRIKDKAYNPNWVHSVLKLPEFGLQQCFFGEHLLKGNTLPVAIVESEKTAIIASVYLPEINEKQVIWLAAGNKTGLTEQKCKVLQGRKVVLYPDLNAFELWTEKAKEFSNIACFTVSGLLERKATEAEKKQGLDLADYLIKFPVSAFNAEAEKPLINQLFSKDIIYTLGETHTPKEFNNIIIAGYKTENGKVYDLLFNKDGELIKPGEQPEAVNYLADFYNKKLQPAMFNASPCWVHIDNRFIVNNN